MTLVRDVKKMLIAANISGISNIYTNSIPADAQNDLTNTDVLITDVDYDYQGYGSNRSTTVKKIVAINIYYSINTKTSADDVEESMSSVFECNGWTCIYSPGHETDPDTGGLTKIFQFQKLERK